MDITQETRGTACSTLQAYRLSDFDYDTTFEEALREAVLEWDLRSVYKVRNHSFLMFSVLDHDFDITRTALEKYKAVKTEDIFNSKNRTTCTLYILTIPQVLDIISEKEETK